MGRVALPADARALTTLPRHDYEDAFRVEIGSARDRTGEQWARALLEEAPAETRRALRAGWTALGLRRGSAQDDRLVLGWAIRRCSPDFALLAAGSPLGLIGEVLVKRGPRELLLATFVRLKNPLARAVWRAVAPGHRRVVRGLLQEAVDREAG